MLSTAVLPLLLALAGCSAEPGGEDRVPPYRIVLEPVATLGSPDDSLLLSLSASVAATDSVFVVGRLPSRGTFAVHDRSGRQVRAVERFGGGPGEFRVITPVAMGDSVWIFDSSNQRVSVLTPDGAAVVREFPLRTGPGAELVPLDSGRAVVGGMLLERGSEGDGAEGAGAAGGRSSPPFLHVIDAEGRVLSSFADHGTDLGRGAIVGARDRIWVAMRHRPTLEEWSVEGERLRRIDRDLDWFEPWDTTDLIEGLRFRPRVAGLALDPAGRLWIRTIVPLADRNTMRGRDDASRVMDVVMEAVDPATGELLARRRFESVEVRPLAGSGLWGEARYDSAGYVYFDVFRPTLEPVASGAAADET